MPVLIQILDLDADPVRVSLGGEALEHYWDAYIASISPPAYEMATPHGGLISLTMGSITFSPEMFKAVWPDIPATLRIIIQATDTNEAAAITLFEGDLYLESFDEEQAVYAIRVPKYAQRMLDLGLDYDGNTVPFPHAFGSVTHVQPLRLPDVLGKPTYHLGGLGTGINAHAIVSFSSSDAGTKTKVVVNAAHGWANGAAITINGTVNFNGTHTIEQVSGTSFVIPVAFPQDNSEKLPIYANAFIAGGFAVYDGGVPIQENVTVNGNGTFSLEATPVSTVTISGTAVQTDLQEVITWCQGRLGIGSINATYQRATPPAVNCWLTSQQLVTDFLSELCAGFTHYAYIDYNLDTCYLGDMLIDAGTEGAKDAFDFFDINYLTQDAVNKLIATYTVREVDMLNVDMGFSSATSYIKERNVQVVESQYTVSSGTANGTIANKLVDSGATFLTDGIKVGDVAYNATDNSTTDVLAVTETQLTLADDIFVLGEDYYVGPAFPYGLDKEIVIHTDQRSEIVTALQIIWSILTKKMVELRVPITASMPNFGKKVTVTDPIPIVETNSWFRVRRQTYDISADEIILKGEGVIS